MNEILHEVVHDTLPMIPFLFITYLLMEFIEHRTNDQFQKKIKNARKLGPFVGSLFGIVPQCGFSVLASGLYINRTISLGTLVAVFISTSDEAIPILIAQPSQFDTLLKVIVIKLIVAIFVGYLVDFLIKNHRITQAHAIKDVHEHCHDEKQKSIFYIALIHTIKIFVFIFVVNFLLSTFIYYIGEERLASLLAQGSLWQPIIAAFVGFIPNCAASILLATLYMDGVISFGALCAGLITSVGLGLLVLLRMYDNKRDILRILSILFISAIVCGTILQYIVK